MKAITTNLKTIKINLINNFNPKVNNTKFNHLNCNFSNHKLCKIIIIIIILFLPHINNNNIIIITLSTNLINNSNNHKHIQIILKKCNYLIIIKKEVSVNLLTSFFKITIYKIIILTI